ncbi:MAG: ribosome biogenesis GTPase YlqF [Oscillospiraceae bacterium]|jgi:ribosome biogenesis GTPase A|nr:ribosome biogenesis GTPase YlqF [Oscillospiraceae bacterium]
MNEKVIQWYPGHMAKTRRLMKESLPLIDAVCELVDARVPESSRNPDLDGIIGSKPRIVLLNKCDLADERATARKIKELAERGVTALPVDCRSGKGLEKFEPAVREVLKDKIKANADKGMAGKPLRVMVVGIPNTGKSSFINRMAGKYRAKVADKPGVTRGNQWFAIGSGIELLDTPGVLWPKFEDPQVGLKLAFIGSIKETTLDIQELAVSLLSVMQKNYPDRLEQRYKVAGVQDVQEPYELLEMIAAKRGMLLRKGEYDTERAAVMLLDEYRSGKLGKITLD